MHTHNLVRHDPAHCLAAGLFRVYDNAELIPRERDNKPLFATNADGSVKLRRKIKDGAATEEPIVLMRRPGYVSEYTYGENILKFSVPEGLGADDLRILQGLIALAGANVLLLGPVLKSKTDHSKQLRMALRATGDAKDKNGLYVADTFYHLAKEIGYKDPGSGSTIRQIRDCIERLYGVSITATNSNTGRSEGFRLLSTYESDITTKSITVGLNPRIAHAVIGGEGSRYAPIDLSEICALTMDGARLIHQRLCAWINRGSTHEVSLETVCSYIWKTRSVNAATHRKHIERTKACLSDICALGWGIEYYKPGHVRISRPAQVKKPALAN